jgi:hypothetical protein
VIKVPRGPKGEKHPADVIGNAVHIMQIATGEATEGQLSPRRVSAGSKGGKVRASRLTPDQRAEAAKLACMNPDGASPNGIGPMGFAGSIFPLTCHGRRGINSVVKSGLLFRLSPYPLL